jgi:hypothetical protein
MERGARCSHFVVGADHGVPAAEIDCVFKIDRTPAIFRLSQGGGKNSPSARLRFLTALLRRLLMHPRCSHESTNELYPYQNAHRPNRSPWLVSAKPMISPTIDPIIAAMISAIWCFQFSGFIFLHSACLLPSAAFGVMRLKSIHRLSELNVELGHPAGVLGGQRDFHRPVDVEPFRMVIHFLRH